MDCHVGSMCMSGSYAEDNKLKFKKKKKGALACKKAQFAAGI